MKYLKNTFIAASYKNSRKRRAINKAEKRIKNVLDKANFDKKVSGHCRPLGRYTKNHHLGSHNRSNYLNYKKSVRDRRADENLVCSIKDYYEDAA